jgi:hypothetical protein
MMTYGHAIIGEKRRAVDRECCSEVAHGNCRFAGEVFDAPKRALCNAPRGSYLECPYSANKNPSVSIFGEGNSK